jgi:hypothetical protein
MSYAIFSFVFLGFTSVVWIPAAMRPLLKGNNNMGGTPKASTSILADNLCFVEMVFCSGAEIF